MQTAAVQKVSQHVRVAIVGSGFSGLGAAIRLRQRGMYDFVLFERAKDVGGTWRDNSYPGCACDVESHLYSFSFAPNPHWSRMYSPQPEIYAYLRRVAAEHGVLPHMRFNHAVHGLVWDNARERWNIETSSGSYTADIVIGGMGALVEPMYPEIPGIEKFQGKTFHSARWDHDYDLRGKRVAVIGTGASAVQFVPEIQKQVAQLTLFQRTAAWVLPRLNREIGTLEKAAYERIPALQKLARATIYARRELFVVGFRNPKVMAVLELVARQYLKVQVPDPVLRKKLTPNFRLGCKRILLTSDYLPALVQPNVAVVDSGIREITENAVIDRDGNVHQVDAIIYGTGFHVTDMPFANIVRGRDGRTLNEHWQGSPKAHVGTTVAGFPNFFMIMGPNTGLGHTSVVIMAEAQIELVMQALTHMEKNGLKVLEPKPEAQSAYLNRVEAMMQGTVWTSGGCNSWYLDSTGRNSILWPSFTFSFMQKARFRPNEYALSRGDSHA